jgi:hypothetical protein
MLKDDDSNSDALDAVLTDFRIFIHFIYRSAKPQEAEYREK